MGVRPDQRSIPANSAAAPGQTGDAQSTPSLPELPLESAGLHPPGPSWWERPPLALSVVLCALVVAGVAFIRLVLVPGKLVPIAYGVPLFLCVWFRDRRLLWCMAAGLLAISFVKFEMEPPEPGYTGTLRYFPWSLIAINQLLMAGVIHFLIGARLALEDRNMELEQSNREISAREAEIAIQNQELQSQAREVEHQTEELRKRNAQIAGRGRILQSLLDLSRSLTAGLPRAEILERICHTAGAMQDDNGESAAAILERHGDRFVVVCHRGFGPEGLAEKEIPATQTFANIILKDGKAAYLEQISQRPELRIPQPRTGGAMRAVLSAPLRVRGQAIGALELYSRGPRSWTAEQVAVVESLAAQASVSLEAARLFEEIESARRRFEAVVQTLPIPALVAEDSEGRVVRGNAAAHVMFGTSADANFTPLAAPGESGPPVRRIVLRAGKAVETADLPLMQALRGDEVRGQEMEMVAQDGRRFNLMASAAPITDAAGKIAGAVLALADVTPFKTLQHELEIKRHDAEEASARKTRFLAAVSHDIRTPANAINLLAELLRRASTNPQLAADVPEMASELQGSAMSLVNLVSDVLDLTRFDSGGVELQPTDFTLSELVLEQQRQMLPLADAKGLEIRVELPADPIYLRADRVKLARVLGNLAGNAIKFTEAGSVTLSAAPRADGALSLIVADTGPGISSEHLPRIFDEFFQIKNPARDRNRGSGLGLAICRALIDAMHGHIDVQSELGRGSTFTVMLPADLMISAAAANDGGAPMPGLGDDPSALLEGVRVLLVEDHPSTRFAASQLLASEGAEVTEAADGQTALRLLGECRPHVVLLDMVLPDLDGREVLKHISAARPPELRSVLVLTGDVTAERSAEVRELGADGLIHKPVDLQTVVAFVRERQPQNV